MLPVGARLAWDNTVKKLNMPDVGRFPIGVVVEVAGNRVTSIAVRLDAVGTVPA